MPVYRPAASSILRSFRASGKRHLLLTGGRGSGKTTLLRALMPFLCPDAPMLLTAAVPGRWVEMLWQISPAPWPLTSRYS